MADEIIETTETEDVVLDDAGTQETESVAYEQSTQATETVVETEEDDDLAAQIAEYYGVEDEDEVPADEAARREEQSWKDKYYARLEQESAQQTQPTSQTQSQQKELTEPEKRAIQMDNWMKAKVESGDMDEALYQVLRFQVYDTAYARNEINELKQGQKTTEALVVAGSKISQTVKGYLSGRGISDPEAEASILNDLAKHGFRPDNPAVAEANPEGIKDLTDAFLARYLARKLAGKKKGAPESATKNAPRVVVDNGRRSPGASTQNPTVKGLSNRELRDQFIRECSG